MVWYDIVNKWSDKKSSGFSRYESLTVNPSSPPIGWFYMMALCSAGVHPKHGRRLYPWSGPRLSSPDLQMQLPGIKS